MTTSCDKFSVYFLVWNSIAPRILVLMRFTYVGPTAIFVIAMLTFSVLGLFEFTLRSATQNRLLFVFAQSTTCDRASALARSDFERGDYLLLRFGLPESLSVVIGEVLASDYGIKQIYGGCGGGNDEIDCYNNTMYSLLQQEYGAEFLLQAREKARRIYVEKKVTL